MPQLSKMITSLPQMDTKSKNHVLPRSPLIISEALKDRSEAESEWYTYMLLNSLPPLPSPSSFGTITQKAIRRFSFTGNHSQEIRQLSGDSTGLLKLGNTPSTSGSSQLCLETESKEWTLWSVWCTDLYKKLVKRGKTDCGEFLRNVLISISNEWEDFPLHLFLEDCIILQLSGQAIYSADGNGKKKFRTEASVMDAQLLASTGTVPTIMLSCEDGLADILSDVLGRNDILIVFGAVLAFNRLNGFNHGGADGTWVLDLSTTDKELEPVNIIRVNRMGKGTKERRNSNNMLIEYIQPSFNDFYRFKYAAVRSGQSSQISRYRKIRDDVSGSKSSIRQLDSFLYPVSKEILSDEAFNVLIFYEWKRDPSWPEFKQRNMNIKKQVSFNTPPVWWYYDPSSTLQEKDKIRKRSQRPAFKPAYNHEQVEEKTDSKPCHGHGATPNCPNYVLTVIRELFFVGIMSIILIVVLFLCFGTGTDPTKPECNVSVRQESENI